MITVFNSPSDTQFDIKLEQSESGNKLFKLTYGLDVKKHLTYNQACHKLGAAILHRACCEGKADNEGA